MFNELIDKLIIRVIFALFLCLIVVIYKYAHVFLYPSTKKQLLVRFYPSKNATDTLHLFSRIIGIGLILSEFSFYMSDGLFVALLDFFIQGTSVSFLFLLSIYIIESIVLYNFEYSDEILKRKNYPYAIISAAGAIGVAFVLKTIVHTAGNSMTLLLFIWPFAIVIMGFTCKAYSFYSDLPFNRLVIQQNMALSFSYLGYFWGWCLIVAQALNHSTANIQWYSIQAILKIILAIIISPILRKGVKLIFKIYDSEEKSETESVKKERTLYGPQLGHGVYEGALFLTSFYLTSIITGQIDFGSFYPV
ncbi:MAG: hypothetical protein ISR65_00215 [Bacteriovoracaceae bacterium]|nr:hypothetical protein [Bacteriovoracaceae bacterium]